MHGIFVALHVIALLFFPVALFLTIPLHVVLFAIGGKSNPDAPRPATHVRCPDCKELIRKEAVVCKHCGCRLTPQP